MAALGVVHRDVRALEERPDGRAVLGIERDADARLQLHGHAAERERAAQGVLQAHRQLDHGAAVGYAVEQDRELVAAEPGERVAAAQDGLQAARDLDQQLVAVVVPERVVDLLEAIEVDQQHRAEPVAAQGALGAAMQERAVGQVGERVVQRLVAQLARGARHDPVERAEEEHEPAGEQQEHLRDVGADRLGHRLVGEVELEHARPARRRG